MSNFSILKALLRKEFTLMRKDPLIPRVIIMLPIMVMIVIPLVANLDVKHVEISIVDNDHSQLSRRIVADIDASDYLNVSRYFSTYHEAMTNLEKGNTDVIVTIPADFEKKITENDNPRIHLAANGVNATKGTLGSAYTASSIGSTLVQWQKQTGIRLPESAVTTQYLYNPTLDFRYFMIPGLMVMLVIIICGFLPALNLVSEKQNGTIEAMNVSPVGKMTFVMSKLIPYWIAGMVVISIGMVIGWAVYGLVPVGNIGAIYVASILFTLVMSGLGLIIANKSETMLQSILVMFAIIMVFQLMSGLFTPISSMPGWARTITYAIPPRYFIEIVRDIYLKGTTMSELTVQYSVLAGMALCLCSIAGITYRKQS